MPDSSVLPTAIPLVIAICGGGIAGLSAAVTLQRLPNVQIHVFEQATAFREVGASIALGPNGMRGLEEIGALSALTDDLAYRSTHGFPMLYRHWKSFEVLTKDTFGPGVTNPLHHTARFYRPHLLASLAENTRPEVVHLHLKKRLVGLDVDEEGATLRFQDGEEFKADLVVGADGLKSIVRQTYDPTFALTFTGQIVLRGVFPIFLLDDLREDTPDIGDSIHVIGPDNHFFSSAMGKGTFTVVGMTYVDPGKRDPDKTLVWNEESDLETFRSYYKDWHPHIRAILARTPSIQAYESWAADYAPQPTHAGRVLLIGDSFHPLGGAYASGGSLAIDDARALYLSLSRLHATDPSATASNRKERLARSLEIYKETRMAHVEHVMEFVRNSRRASAKRPGESRSWSEEKIQEWAREKKSVRWLHEHDVHQAFSEALKGKRSEPVQAKGADEGCER